MSVPEVRAMGLGEIALFAGPALSMAMGLAGAYAAVCLIDDYGTNRVYSYEKPVPMSGQKLAGVCAKFFQYHGLQEDRVFFSERNMVESLLKEKESLDQDLSNAARCVRGRERTSWLGRCVRMAVDTVSSGGKDKGTVRCAKEKEKECWEKLNDSERRLSSFAGLIKARLRLYD